MVDELAGAVIDGLCVADDNVAELGVAVKGYVHQHANVVVQEPQSCKLHSVVGDSELPCRFETNDSLASRALEIT